MKYYLMILLLIPSLANAFSLSLGDEKLYIDAEYKAGRVNGESDGSITELSISYDPSFNSKWSGWGYNTARRLKDKSADISFEDFLGGGIKYNFTDNLSLSYGPTGHYINEQWDWLHSWRLKLKGDLYATLFYQNDFGLKSHYLTKGIVGYKIGKHLSLWHKRERREGYQKIYNGIGVHYEL